MNKATRLGIAGLLSMIRQACMAIEAHLTLDDDDAPRRQATSGTNADPERFLSDDEEEKLGKLFFPEEDPDAIGVPAS